jgi:hypothetical protein
MSTRIADKRTGRMEMQSAGARDVVRLLALLAADEDIGSTIAALCERGIQAPARAVYDLQIAGYHIDRTYCQDTSGHRSLRYRLRASTARGPDRSTGLQEEVGDEA